MSTQNTTIPIIVRAHHLLCLQGFQGLGYSTEFIKNMQRLVNLILSPSLNPKLKLVVGQDDFCSSCPHHGKVTCNKDQTSDERMKNRDQATLNLLGLSESTEAYAINLLELVQKKITSQQGAKPVCSDCEWQSNCAWHQKLPVSPTSF